MHRYIAAILTIFAALALTATGLADPGEKGKSKKHNKKFEFTVTTTDNGSCGNPWATDVIKRTFHVKKNRDGTYRLTRRDRGKFVTLAGQSPGACDTTGKHGTTIAPGVQGKMVGYLRGTVSGGTFNPNATCTAPAAECGFTDVFLATYFGAGAQFSCWTNSTDCRFVYNYTAPAKNNPDLLYRHWQDKGKGAGTMGTEEFSGDIATA